MAKDNPNKKTSQLKPIYKKVNRLHQRNVDYQRIIEDSLGQCERLVKEKNSLEEELEKLKAEGPLIVMYDIEEDPLCARINEILDQYGTEESKQMVKIYEERLGKQKCTQNN